MKLQASRPPSRGRIYRRVPQSVYRPTPQVPPNQLWKRLLAIGCVVCAIGIAVPPSFWESIVNFQRPVKASPALNCGSINSESTVLPGAVVQKIMAIPVGADRRPLEEQLPKAYCKLPSITVRAGVSADRLLYWIEPTSTGAQTLILLFEGTQYVGFSLQ